ncbi:PAS domain-containing sensor histidine kinase [Pseudomonas putida]|nr:PAS domain-containing sensor histidine kinase [Pseudomonas putida]
MSVEAVGIPDAEALYQQAPCALVLTNDKGLILKVNQTFCHWLAYTHEQLVGVRKLQELLTVGSRIFYQTHWMPLLVMQRSITEVKLDFLTADGKVTPMVLNAGRREHQGQVFDEVSAFIVADRIRFEQELLQAKRQAEDALQRHVVLEHELNRQRELAVDRALFAEQMIGIVSHDLRNPLQVVSMAAQYLRSLDMTERQSTMLSHIGEATARSQRLINDLLDFTQARIGQGLAVNRAPVQLDRAIAAAVGSLRLLYPHREIVFSTSDEALFCQADADRLAQLLGNLVSNAMTYGDGTSPVEVRVSAAQGTVEIAVHNVGEPIDEAELGSIFSPMTRGSELGREVRSVGLGLFIVSEIAKAHGGVVEVVSSALAGTTFTTRFPAYASAG